MSTRPDPACALALDLTRDLDEVLTRDLDDPVLTRNPVLTGNLDDARDLVLTRALARVLARDLDVDLALDLARALAAVLNLAIHPAQNLVAVVDQIHGQARELRLGLDKIRICAHDLANAMSETPLTKAAARIGSGEVAGSASGPSRASVRLVVWVLPAADRARYREEFASELEELTEAGVSARDQLLFAVRLGARVWALRAALRAESPVPRRSR